MAPDAGPFLIDDLPIDRHLIEQIIEWQLAHYADAFPSFDRTDWTSFYASWVHHGTDALPIVLGAYEGDECVGTVAIVAHDDLDDDRTPWVAAMIVHPDKRGRNIGTALLAGALNRCRDEGIRRIHLWTHDQAEWYARAGWTTDGTQVFRGVEITVFSRTV